LEEDYEEGFSRVVEDIFSLREANIAMTFAISLILISGGWNVYKWTQDEYDVARDAATDDSWLVEFNVSMTNAVHEETWQDEEKKTVTFYMDEFEIPDGYLVGEIEVIVKPDADSNGTLIDPVAQCDSIGANLLNEGDLTAQWDYDGNVLSGQDSSCEWIRLNLRTYPGFDGEDLNSSAPNEFQALLPWKQTGWGEGILEVEVELDVNTVDVLGPISSDDDEDITIEVIVSGFVARASLEPSLA
tara:strand:- start:3613 stop:4344 length:732 start_codon:yes stop_codon:yes gene_type:complete